MKEVLYPVIGILLIFVCTTLGSTFVFFIRKKEISPIFLRLSLTYSTAYIQGVQHNDLTYIYHEMIITISLVNIHDLI